MHFVSSEYDSEQGNTTHSIRKLTDSVLFFRNLVVSRPSLHEFEIYYGCVLNCIILKIKILNKMIDGGLSGHVLITNLYYSPTEKYLNNYISMPYPTEDNIANPCIENSRYRWIGKLKSILKNSLILYLPRLLFMPLIHDWLSGFNAVSAIFQPKKRRRL